MLCKKSAKRGSKKAPCRSLGRALLFEGDEAMNSLVRLLCGSFEFGEFDFGGICRCGLSTPDFAVFEVLEE